MNDQIKVICSRLSQEMVELLSESFEQFGNEMSSRMSSLKDVQGVILSGLGNTAQDLGIV